jgi:hypothetical protein
MRLDLQAIWEIKTLKKMAMHEGKFISFKDQSFGSFSWV